MTDRRRERTITMTVNGVEHSVETETRTLLVDVLRHQLQLTGTHVGCEQGSCGACTIICDGRAVRSCLMLAPQADGAVIETIESVAATHAVVATMHEQHGLQCGFCTAGIVMSLVTAQRDGWSTEAAIEDALGGHLCRCTGYVNIRAAIRQAFGET
jgi:aerobic-type carbon monoxide dehydrogenase small subunit (CoxS/CutS family)